MAQSLAEPLSPSAVRHFNLLLVGSKVLVVPAGRANPTTAGRRRP